MGGWGGEQRGGRRGGRGGRVGREQPLCRCCGAAVPPEVAVGDFWGPPPQPPNPCRFAKERKLRIWRDYVAPTANLEQKDKQFVAKVSLGCYYGMHGSLQGSVAAAQCYGMHLNLQGSSIGAAQCLGCI